MHLIIGGLFKEVWPHLSNMVALILESVIRGHHIYKSSWTPLIGETLNTSLELDNEHDKYAVSIYCEVRRSSRSCAMINFKTISFLHPT